MKKLIAKKITADFVRKDAAKQRLLELSAHPEEKVLRQLNSAPSGLCAGGVETARSLYGKNIPAQKKGDSLLKRLSGAFINPFTAILFALALVSVVTDIILAAPGERNATTVIIITAMVSPMARPMPSTAAERIPDLAAGIVTWKIVWISEAPSP